MSNSDRLLALIALALWFFIKRRIINPLNFLRNRADELATNTGMDEPLKYEKDDEFGDLTAALDKMRNSIQLAFARLRK